MLTYLCPLLCLFLLHLEKIGVYVRSRRERSDMLFVILNILFIVSYITVYVLLKTSREKFLLKVKQDFQDKLQKNEEIAFVSDYHFGLLELNALAPSILLVCIVCFFKTCILFSILFLFILVASLYYLKDASKYNIFIITNKNIYPYFYNERLYNRMKNNYKRVLHGFCETISFEEIEYVEPTFFNFLVFGVQIKLKNKEKKINGFSTNNSKEIAEYINSRISKREE